MLTALKTSILTLATALAIASPALAEDVLGSRKVTDHSDTDVIDVSNAKLYTAIKVCVAQRAVDFHDLDVWFANGGHQDADLRHHIGIGECSRWIDLAGGARHIDRIVMKYDAISGGVQAIVTAYGR